MKFVRSYITIATLFFNYVAVDSFGIKLPVVMDKKISYSMLTAATEDPDSYYSDVLDMQKTVDTVCV